MPRKAIQQITAWSFSRWNTYNQCPRKAKKQIIDKIRIAPNEAMQRGTRIHALAEKYVNGTIKPLPPELELFDDEFHQLTKLKKKPLDIAIDTELQWAFDRNWVTCDWFGRQAWGRVVVDLSVLNKADRRATIIDHKTGKIRDDYEEQLDLYAAATLARYQDLDKVQTELWYLDQGEIRERLYTRDEADDLIKVWTNRVKPMLADKRFAPKPSYLCKWCDFSHNNGGDCEY